MRAVTGGDGNTAPSQVAGLWVGSDTDKIGGWTAPGCEGCEFHQKLAFFPLAFTSTCTTELCAFSEDFDQFEGAGVAVLPISVDSIPTLKEFKAKHAAHLTDAERRDVTG